MLNVVEMQTLRGNVFCKPFTNSQNCSEILFFRSFIELGGMFHGILNDAVPLGDLEIKKEAKRKNRRHGAWFLTAEFRD